MHLSARSFSRFLFSKTIRDCQGRFLTWFYFWSFRGRVFTLPRHYKHYHRGERESIGITQNRNQAQHSSSELLLCIYRRGITTAYLFCFRRIWISSQHSMINSLWYYLVFWCLVSLHENYRLKSHHYQLTLISLKNTKGSGRTHCRMLSHVVQSAETANGRASGQSRYIPNRNPLVPFSHVITVAHLMIFSVQRQGHGIGFDWLQWRLNSGSCMTGRSGFCPGMWLVG